MKVILADKTGFCFGVKRAVDMAENALKKKNPIYSLGSIIHNKEVVSRLSEKGLKIVSNLGNLKNGAVLISSHGISPRIASAVAAKGLEIIDTTCPFVRNAQRIAKHLSEEGYKVIIVGDAGHPEVKALMDFVVNKAVVVKNMSQAAALKLDHLDKIGVISQTTQSQDNFLEAVKKIMEKKPKEIRVFNTICNDAGQRQSSARRLAKKVGLMLVVGGKDSANTRRLLDVCKKDLKRSYLLETDRELNRIDFNKIRVAGVVSGASTPDWIVKKVVKKIKKKGVV